MLSEKIPNLSNTPNISSHATPMETCEECTQIQPRKTRKPLSVPLCLAESTIIVRLLLLSLHAHPAELDQDSIAEQFLIQNCEVADSKVS